jgi:hypothetical protein
MGHTWGLDHGCGYGAGQGLRQYERHGQKQPPDEWLKHVGDRTRNRDTEYSKLQPEIANLRHDIQVGLNWTPQQIVDDNRRFESLNTTALRPHIPAEDVRN